MANFLQANQNKNLVPKRKTDILAEFYSTFFL